MKKICLSFLLILITTITWSQKFSSAVQQFIRYSQDTIALIHVNIIDGSGGPAKADQTVLVIQGRFAAISGNINGRIPMPLGTRVIIDCSGKTIIPGMVMMHEHMFYGESQPPFYIGQAMPLSFPKLYLAGGATTIRTTGTVEPQTDLNIRKWIGEGKMTGPDMDVTTPYIEREGIPIPEMLFVKNTAEAERETAYWIDMGCTSVKAYMDITRADLDTVIAVAHKKNVKVTGHLCSITFREAATAGIDNLEHGFMVSTDFAPLKESDKCTSGTSSLLKMDVNDPAMKDLISYLVQKNVAITSTLPVFEPYTGREIIPGGGDSALLPQIREKLEKQYHLMERKDSGSAALFRKEMAWEKMFVDMGGRLMAGIDPTGAGRVIPGYADRHVLELLVEAGFSFPLAVKICSLNAAEYMGRDKEIGSISVGKRADFVIMNGNPEKDIRSVRNTELVFKNGIGFDSKKIFESVKGKVGMY